MIKTLAWTTYGLFFVAFLAGVCLADHDKMAAGICFAAGLLSAILACLFMPLAEMLEESRHGDDDEGDE